MSYLAYCIDRAEEYESRADECPDLLRAQEFQQMADDWRTAGEGGPHSPFQAPIGPPAGRAAGGAMYLVRVYYPGDLLARQTIPLPLAADVSRHIKSTLAAIPKCERIDVLVGMSHLFSLDGDGQPLPA